MSELTPFTPLAEWPDLPPRTLSMLEKAGLRTAADLFTRYPHRYEDRRHFGDFPFDETPGPVCLHARVVDCGVKKFGWKKYAEIFVEDVRSQSLAPRIRCRWFNMHWIAKSFAAGQEVVLFGRVKGKRAGLTIDHPDFEIIEPGDSVTGVHMGRVVPVYPLGDGLLQKPLRQAIHAALAALDPESVPELLPPAAVAATGLTRAEAWQRIHFPETLAQADEARRRLALEEFFALQLNVLHRRQQTLAQPGTEHGGAGTLLGRWQETLPFSLTGAQLRSIDEIRRDMAAPRPMNRLLQGDVGSGKTFVALASALVAAESGFQTAIMAPTQILAEQHYLNFQRHLAPLGLSVALRTSARKEESALPLFAGGEGPPQIVVGTHALLFDDAVFQRLGLVVIDEQHKFGVAQRARLVSAGRAPDVLVMTATPIPRTLALTLYGDLDVSVLDESPAGRGKITTAVRGAVDLGQVTSFLRQQLEKGRQAYVVYPLVEESDKLAVKAATVEFENWRQRLPDVPVSLLHGRLKPEEKDAVMADFRAGRTKVLVSTTVIEVGVDVPNANLMLVFNAERFGLAQLHQLRGRVGRGAHTSYCVLICAEGNADALDRLQILEKTRDGFEIAEADLRQRGPGELLGQRQSGLPDLRLGDLAADTPLIHQARELAAAILAADPELKTLANRPLRRLLVTPDDSAAQN